MMSPFELCSGDRSIYRLVAFGRGRNCADDLREVNYRKVCVKAFMLLLTLL